MGAPAGAPMSHEGLSLLVKPMTNGRLSKPWAQRLLVNGKPVNIGLGSYLIVTLAEPRAEALTNRRAKEKGVDPRIAFTNNKLKDIKSLMVQIEKCAPTTLMCLKHKEKTI